MKDLPRNFKDWYTDNTDRIARAKSQPYFLRDNQKLIEKNVQKTITIKDAQKYWNILNPEKFNNGIADKFDWKTFHDELLDVTSKHGIELKTFSMALSDKSTEFTVVGDGFRMIRNLGLEEGTLIANHNFLLLSKENQNKGLSKDIFRSLYKQYKNAGVEMIKVTANKEVGGYAWARYGFYAKDKVSALNAVISDDAKLFIEDYYKKNNLKASDSFPMRLIVDNFNGKFELLESSWDGIIDLKNKKAREEFENFIMS